MTRMSAQFEHVLLLECSKGQQVGNTFAHKPTVFGKQALQRGNWMKSKTYKQVLSAKPQAGKEPLCSFGDITFGPADR